jgi:hypothetical protein
MMWSVGDILFELPVGASDEYINNTMKSYASWADFMAKEIVRNKTR